MPNTALKVEHIFGRSPELKKYIEERQALFWYSPAPKSESVSDELLVEHILNYGSMDDVRALFKVMSIKDAANIFFNSINKSERRKNNYFDIIINYFTLFFNKYAS